MRGIRQRILEIIREHGQVTVMDLAEALHLAPVSVRHHLDILRGDGLIIVTGVERRPQAGRPKQVYALTNEALEHFPNNYQRLAAALLAAERRQPAITSRETLLKSVAEQMAREARLPAETNGFPERLPQVVHYLTDLGYAASWRQIAKGRYRLQTSNCPYAALIEEFPELCQLDKSLMEQLVGRPVEEHICIRNGYHSCQYIFTETA